MCDSSLFAADSPSVALIIVGGAWHDRARRHLPASGELSALFELFENRGFALSITMVDPMHRTALDEELLATPEYARRRADVHMEAIALQAYRERHPSTAPCLIFDFSGTLTCHEMITFHGLDILASPHLLFPLGCLAESFRYVPFLEPLLPLEPPLTAPPPPRFHHTALVNAIVDNITQNADKFAHLLDFLLVDDDAPRSVETYLANFAVLEPLLSAIVQSEMASLPASTTVASLDDFRSGLRSFYAGRSDSACRTALTLHESYLEHAKKEHDVQVRNIRTVLAGLHKYQEVQSWYACIYRSLGNINLTTVIYLLAIAQYAAAAHLFERSDAIEDIFQMIVA